MDNKSLLKSLVQDEQQQQQASGRLQSLRIPRDLTLGLNKTKKQYIPNLNVVRNKDKSKEFPLKKAVDIKPRDKFSKKSNRNYKDDNNRQQRFIQSDGVFSQGAAELRRPPFGGGNTERRPNILKEPKDGTEGGSTTTPTGGNKLTVPKLNRNLWNVSKQTEDSVLDDILHGNMEEQEMSDEELSSSFQPVNFNTNIYNRTENEIHRVFSTKLWTDENPLIGVVRLPDSFPGKGLSDDPNVKRLLDFPLRNIHEGQIGKLIIRKSGKVQAQIGSVFYDLSTDFTNQSKEELVAITKNAEDYCISALGKVTHNFTMSPDFEQLLRTV